MRFKAKLNRPKVLKDICGSLASLRKTCHIRLDPKSLKLISLADKRTTQLWATLNLESMFEHYELSSVCNNIIIIELNIEALFRALKSYNSSSHRHDEVWIRLRRHNRVPYLVVIFRQHSFVDEDVVQITQEMPVRLLKVDDFEGFREPVCPPPNVYIMLPDPNSSVLRICERYRHISGRITVKANNHRMLSMEVRHEGVKINTTWTNAINVRAIDQEESACPPDEVFAVTVDSREWWGVLQVVNVAKRIIMGICNNYALIVHCYITDPEDDEEEVLMYYMSHLGE